MRKLLIIIISLILSGCASVQYNRLTKEPLPKLDSSGSAYVLVPDDAMYFTKKCIGSGELIGNVIYVNFSKYLKRVEIAPSGEKLIDGMRKAKDSGFTYLVDSKILRWEDHPTEWSGQMDRIDMQMDIHDVKANRLIDSVNFVGRGTWVTWGGYHPQHILNKGMPEYVDSLFQATGYVEVK
jgi:hypothetical protein